MGGLRPPLVRATLQQMDGVTRGDVQVEGLFWWGRLHKRDRPRYWDIVWWRTIAVCTHPHSDVGTDVTLPELTNPTMDSAIMFWTMQEGAAEGMPSPMMVKVVPIQEMMALHFGASQTNSRIR